MVTFKVAAVNGTKNASRASARLVSLRLSKGLDGIKLLAEIILPTSTKLIRGDYDD